MIPIEQEWRERLKRANLRVTAPRLAVLQALAEGGAHSDAESLAALARQRLGTLSTQAVYDNLHALVEIGLVRRIEPAGHPARYELRVGDNHHHIICRKCGRTEDVNCAMGAAPCLQPSEDHGFVVEEAEVIFWGLCRTCQNQGDQGEQR